MLPGSRRGTSSSGKWSPGAIPSLDGRRAVVTGANTGLGRPSRALAREKASVVLACRNLGKGKAALAEVRAAVPGGLRRIER